MPVKIPIRDEFDDKQGRFQNYDSFDSAQRGQLAKQKHVNIRSFYGSDISIPGTVPYLDALAMTFLNTQQMQGLEGTIPFRTSEQWTAGTVAKQSDRKNWRGISLSCSTGTNTTSSVINPPTTVVLNAPSTIETVDLDTGFDNADFISVSLPALPVSTLTLGSCFIDFTSHPTANFATGPTDSISFTGRLTPGTTGDNELRFLRSLLATVDKSKITGVRFRIQATGSTTFRCLAIRLVSKDWVYAPVDIETRYGRLESTPSINGAAAPTSAFPAATYDWPIMLRSDDPPGVGDPRPIDSKITVGFNTGSKLAASDNIIRLYFRELSLDYMSQLDLDPGTTDITSQLELDSLGYQPDFGIARYSTRAQSYLIGEPQSGLDGDLMGDLERVEDVVTGAWIEVELKWRAAAQSLTIKDTEGNSYTFTPALAANKDYVMLVDMVDNAGQVRIYETDSLGNILWNTLVFDSTKIVDGFLFKRRRGRIGWYAHFEDGDAYISDYRTRGLVFAEHKSAPLRSITPVKGARLFAAASPPRDLFTGVGVGPYGGAVAPDTTKSSSGKCFKITNTGATELQGIQTNEMYMDQFEETEIEFDILFPQNALAPAPPETFLLGEYGRVIQLGFPRLIGDQWQHVKLDLTPALRAQTGPYRLVILQVTAGVSTTWYIDNIHVPQRAIAWSGRSVIRESWEYSEADWTPFRNLLSNLDNGVVFPERGNTTQIRAAALQQDATISQFKIQPLYAELGRLIWDDEQVSNALPTAAFTYGATTKTAFLNGSASADPGGRLVAYHWAFGDGQYGSGADITHVYELAGTYSVTLTVIDNNGGRKSVTQSVTVP